MTKRLRGLCWGRFLPADALLYAVCNEVASFVTIFDAKDEVMGSYICVRELCCLRINR